jgi:hypothetical protein
LFQIHISSNSFPIHRAISDALAIGFVAWNLATKVFHRQKNVKLIFEYLKTSKKIRPPSAFGGNLPISHPKSTGGSAGAKGVRHI